MCAPLTLCNKLSLLNHWLWLFIRPFHWISPSYNVVHRNKHQHQAQEPATTQQCKSQRYKSHSQLELHHAPIRSLFPFPSQTALRATQDSSASAINLSFCSSQQFRQSNNKTKTALEHLRLQLLSPFSLSHTLVFDERKWMETRCFQFVFICVANIKVFSQRKHLQSFYFNYYLYK